MLSSQDITFSRATYSEPARRIEKKAEAEVEVDTQYLGDL